MPARDREQQKFLRRIFLHPRRTSNEVRYSPSPGPEHHSLPSAICEQFLYPIKTPSRRRRLRRRLGGRKGCLGPGRGRPEPAVGDTPKEAIPAYPHEMWRVPGRLLLMGASCLTACLCICAGPSSAAASQTEQRVANSWPARFCRPVSRVMGIDATNIVERAQTSPDGTNTKAAVARLGRDIEAALKQAPTARLRRELAQYNQNVGTGHSTQQVLNALSHFDLVASTQLRNCGLHPIQR